MNTFIKILKRVSTQSCVCFTIVLLAIFLIGSSFPGFGNAIEVKRILSIFGFSVLLSCANLILHAKRFPLLFRILLHFVASALPYYVLFVIIIAGRTSTGAVMADLLLFAILYAVIMGVYLFFRASYERMMEIDKKPYESIYKK